MTVMPQVFLLLSTQILAQADGQPIERRVREIVVKNYMQVDPSQRDAYASRIAQALAPYAGTPHAEEAIGRVEYWASYPSFKLSAFDYYRESASQYVELQPLVLPDTYYFRAYQHSVELIENELANAKLVPPADETKRQIEVQLEAIRDFAKETLGTRVMGKYAHHLLETLIKERVDSLRDAIGKPFAGIHRPLGEEELSELRSSLVKRTEALPLILIESPELSDAKLAFASVGVKTGDGTFAKLEEFKDIYAKVSASLVPFGMVYELNNPAAYDQIRNIRNVASEAKEWMASTKATHGQLFSRVMAEEGLQKFRSVHESKKRRERIGSTAGSGSETSAIQPPANETTSGRPGVNSTERDGSSVRLWLGALLLFALASMAYLVLRSRTRLGAQRR